MGKFPIADEQLSRIVVCRKCKARNKAGVTKCRKCGSKYLRPKSKEIKVKK
jgi:large subunit ribosomal protein L40e